MSEVVGRSGGRADSSFGAALETTVDSAQSSDRPTARPADRLTCNRCGFPVRSKPWGCKNPCANCGTVYPLGDCSD